MNADISCTANFTLPLVIGAASVMPAGEKGVFYNGDLQISGGTFPYTAVRVGGKLPPGITIDNSGIISGTPAGLAKNYNFTVRVRDQWNTSVIKSFTFPIAKKLRIASSGLKQGKVGQSYFALLKAVRGKTPYSWSIVSGVLPPGLSLDGGTGALTGTPTQGGGFAVSYQVADPLGGLAVKSLTIKIN
jgi:hypothetical protein